MQNTKTNNSVIPFSTLFLSNAPGNRSGIIYMFVASASGFWLGEERFRARALSEKSPDRKLLVEYLINDQVNFRNFPH